MGLVIELYFIPFFLFDLVSEPGGAIVSWGTRWL